ncbi:dihydrofolate reductase family protein [Pseudonocardia sp. KRD-184]|uniref:Dihydrofolate reductase family protein n=2 Tax=Pseudonocardia oceani TaxID=2792013 RepID=A0ABS6U6M2_9PSEU|nr:dihydrofolate reductase family protein [Pseudonocardia oceani]MBW0088464.1 dihydrofolate reductase family protein [Pseudonocardia oceani]MBW0095186.1 dihydrofolate reductase family protein [Pseudonocardia oceani]MBW0108024.1 dihydrofolate reductase family protein [Pseudonocardia oceani]MBW0120736.1 dihydrofolate reductase family protein [Pseudonocardia oceani]MBW0127878.1 dihydrofolate reductase family protein [Pseudonocardia oceani]
MGTLVYAMTTSLDGYVEDPTGGIGFSEPDEEVHRFANRQTRDTAAFLFGRGLHDVMEEYWTAPERADGDGAEAEFAREYTATPRIVFSDSLASVGPGCRLVRRADAVDEVVRLKARTGGELAVGGARLAASLLDLVDEFRVTVMPAVTGGGTPYLPLGTALALRLVEQRTFGSGAVHLRYARVR